MRPTDAPSCHQLPALLLLAQLAVVLTLALNPAHAASPGKWTPKVMWDTTAANDSSTAIHMLLVRGDGLPYHSKLMWFGGEPLEVFRGGIKGWTPGNEGCEAFPSTSFTAITPPTVGHNIFCSGHSGLADGRVFLAGGHSEVTGAFGVANASIHTISSGTSGGQWDSTAKMQAWRWYPTNTTLNDGRVLVTAGFQHRQHWLFGGRLGGSAPSSPSADTVRRWAPNGGGAWDPPVLPLPDGDSNPPRPFPCEGHTGTALLGVPNFQGKTFFFGGKRATGAALDHVWTLRRADNPTGPDYSYQWERRTPSGTGPSARSEHSASLGRDRVYIFGGREEDGTPKNDAFVYTTGPEERWDPIIIDSGEPPSPRMGHIAFYNEMAIRENDVDKYVQRLIVHGGVATAGSTPTDKRVYELRLTSFDPPHGYWREMADTSFLFAGHEGGPPLNAPPAPRYWHRVASRGDNLLLAGAAPPAKVSFVVGGALGNGAYSDSLWMMCVFASNKVGWALRDLGSRPSKRARFSMAFDIEQGTTNGAPRIYVHGGEGPSGLADPGVYVADPYFFGSKEWVKWGEAGYSATGHVSVSEEDETHARYGEIYDPSNGTWTRLSGALLEHSYPVTFSVSGGSTAGGRVVTASSWDDTTRYVDLPGPGSNSATWTKFPNGALGFLAEAGVLYRPDRLLIAGGAMGSTVVGISKTLDASNTNNAWVTSDTMSARFYHNLVLLPDGKVLATGGATSAIDYNNHPVLEPQIWDPAGASGAGTWTDPGTLDASTAIRGYHSTSVLLPDGRVVCAGGWGSGGEGGGIHEDQVKADIFCPPYLFNADGSLANRPVILEAPEQLNYNERFSLCLATDTVTLGSVALLRPGMTTHAFDQNQRYVPLTWALEGTTTGEKRTYSVNVPWSASQAPPGDYLLFAVNGAGTPGIARWVRLGSPSLDTTHPEQVTTLEKVCSYGESMDLRWNPPAGDSAAMQSCPSPVQAYEMRYSRTPMDEWLEFQQGTQAATPSLPGMPGPEHWDEATITGLTPDTRYYVRLVSKDYAGDVTNWSAMSPLTSFLSTYQECGEFAGGGGGGSSLRRATGPTSASAVTAETSPALNTLLANAPAGTSRTDRMLLSDGPEWAGTGARVHLSRTGTRGTHVDGVRLLAVDLPSGKRAYARGAGLVTGTPAAPVSVTHVDGRPLGAALAEGIAFSGTERDTLLVVLAGEGAGALALTSAGAQLVHLPSQSGIDVQCRQGDEWITVGRHHPRALGGEEVFDVPDVSAVRLVFLGEHRLVGVAGLADAAAAQGAAHQPVAASHSVDGPALETLAGDGVTLDPDEQLLVDFAASAPPEGSARAWFLEVTAAHAAPPPSVPSAASNTAERPAAPAVFALRQNRPNPLADMTTIGFDLPSRSHVELTVFDLLGRRVAVLAQRPFEPGRHELAWDRTDVRGRVVRPGVYVYRLIAGSHRQQRTMVVVR